MKSLFSMACGGEGSGMVPKMWDTPLWEGVWPCLDPWDSVRLRTASTHRNVQQSNSLVELSEQRSLPLAVTFKERDKRKEGERRLKPGSFLSV